MSVADTLKHREAWKYVALEKALCKRQHEFEYTIGEHVFDLALLDTKTLVEFDGPYHRHREQKKTDAVKERAAIVAGFAVVHRAVIAAAVIDPATLAGL